MAFENLSEGLRNAINSLRKAVVLDKKTVKEYTKEIQKTLLSADVNVKLVFELTKRIEERGLLEKPPGALTKKENLIRITYEELVNLLGENVSLELKDGQKILLVGTQGSGKTTTVAKLAKFLKKHGFNPKIICADTFRAAAYEQLKQLSQEIDVSFYGNPNEKNAIKIINDGLKELKSGIFLIDSEGRHSLDNKLMNDIKEICKNIKIDKTFLVLDATIGQAAGEQAKAFKNVCNVDGIILTKLDGTAKGGGALSACKETNTYVYFIGTGEHIDDFEEFNAKRFVSKLLGFGDIQGLLEKAKEVKIDEESAERFISGEFTLVDLQQQIEQISKLGPLKKVMEMMPFGFNIPKNLLEIQEEKLKKFKVAMQSMTKEEKENPEIIRGSRIERIAKGSGIKQEEVRELLSYYKKMKKLTKMMSNERKMKMLMQKFGMGT
ncbi:MAG: signal recognition particle receptor subunit alpha [Candidatus Altiarchaeota archaeon]